jgi:predicted RND superfamily exporter protein
VLTFTDLLRRTDEAFNGELKAGPGRLPSYAPDQLEQLYLLAELAGNNDLRDFVTEDKRTVQIVAMTAAMSSRTLQDFKDRVYLAGKRFLPAAVDLKLTGTTVQWANMDRDISTTQLDSTYILSIIFMVLLPIILRSFALGALAVVVNALPMGMTLGVMGLLDIKINIATALIGGVVVGATVDSTVFFVNRVKQNRRANMSWDQAVDAAVLSVGDGTIVTSFIVAGGFLCLTTSQFAPTANFGALVCLSMLVALFMDIVINPIVLKLTMGRLPGRSSEPLVIQQTGSES